jgi:hypothetical protein
LHAISINPPIGFGFNVIKPDFDGGSEFHPDVVGSDHCQCNFLVTIIKYVTLLPDVILCDVVEGALGNLEKNASSNLWVRSPVMDSCTGVWE